MGTPFAYRKFSGGLEIQFIGYNLNYKDCALGITKARGEALLSFIADMQANRFRVSMRRFAEFSGRLAFGARVFPWVKPHQSPFYAWSAAVRGTVATAPKLVRLVMLYLKMELEEEEQTFMQTVRAKWVSKGERFRTDAKCEHGKVTLGGHDNSGRWFSLGVGPAQASTFPFQIGRSFSVGLSFS